MAGRQRHDDARDQLRLAIAREQLQVLVAGMSVRERMDTDIRDVAQRAVALADALLEALKG